jgi:hypothetical protein
MVGLMTVGLAGVANKVPNADRVELWEAHVKVNY